MEIIYFLFIDIKIRAAERKMTYCEVRESWQIGPSTHFLYSNYSALYKEQPWSILIYEFSIGNCALSLAHVSKWAIFPNACKHSPGCFRGFSCWSTWTLTFAGQPCKDAECNSWDAVTKWSCLDCFTHLLLTFSQHFACEEPLWEHTFPQDFRAFASLCCNVPAWSCAPCCGGRGQVLFQETPS